MPGAVGAGLLGAGVDGAVLAVGASVGKRVGVAVGDEVDLSVGKADRGGPVLAVAFGAGCVDFFVVCGVVSRGLGYGVLVGTGVGVVATVDTGGSMR